MANYLNYQITGRPIRDVNDVAMSIQDDGDENNWRDRAQRLQSRRWKKIMKNG